MAGWTLADYQQYWRAKRGSAGRANPGAQLRVVDDDGAALGPDQVGLLEVKPGQLGPSAEWMRTTDMARIDADGFVWIVGRADQAIIRGGFKVMPDDVRTALEGHPAVAGAAVVGRPDARLGETPVAMVELRESASADAAELADYLRKRLARYEIPTDIAIVGAIPRTPSGKADLSAIRRFFGEAVYPWRPCPVIPPRSPRSCDTKPAHEADHPLLVCDSDRVSYTEADRRSAELARGLIAFGAGKGTHVGLLYPNGTDFVVGMLAAARIGAVVVPFSTFVTVREMREQLVHSDVEILLSAASFRSHDYVQRLAQVLRTRSSTRPPVVRHRRTTIAPGRDLLRPGGVADPRIRRVTSAPRPSPRILSAMEDDVDGSDLLAIVYTSGSTSAPKGVMHTHAALLEHQQNLNAIRGLTAGDRLFCNSPFFWIGGFAFGLLATLVAGSTLVCSNASNAGNTLDLLEAEKPTMTNGFAAGIAHLARASELCWTRPVVDASGQFVSDHGAQRPAGRPGTSAQHAGDDRGRQRGADQRRRIRPTRRAAWIVRQAGARLRDNDHRA